MICALCNFPKRQDQTRLHDMEAHIAVTISLFNLSSNPTQMNHEVKIKSHMSQGNPHGRGLSGFLHHEATDSIATTLALAGMLVHCRLPPVYSRQYTPWCIKWYPF